MNLPAVVVNVGGSTFSGTLFGVPADVYTTVEGAAQALEEAHILGADVFGFEEGAGRYYGETFNQYREAAQENYWAVAGAIQRRYASMIRSTPQERWVNILSKIPRWAFGGGIFATLPKPKEIPNPTVVPTFIQGLEYRYHRISGYSPSMFTRAYYNSVVDLRHLRPIHTYPAGEGLKGIEEKKAKMRDRLEEFKKSFPDDWKTKEIEILEALTWNDREWNDWTEERISVGRFGKAGELLIIDGHDYLASLCLLAASGDIPLEWLRHIPVSMHAIEEERFIDEITVGMHITLPQFLSPVEIEGVKAKRALVQLEESFPKKEDPAFALWELPKEVEKNMGRVERELDALVASGHFSREEADRHLIQMILENSISVQRDYLDFFERLRKDRDLQALVMKEISEDPLKAIPFADTLYVVYPEKMGTFIQRLLTTNISTELFLAMDLKHSLEDFWILNCVRDFLRARHFDPQLQNWFFERVLNRHRILATALRMLDEVLEFTADPAILDTDAGSSLQSIAERIERLKAKKEADKDE